ncbi:sigma-70 family RNA polymerase sigma factor [Xanthobacter sp. KR7-65]|uniref:sigma-70 family RNA polymerase sigma factor n=1 Tax=Xanthobacter sp. KR7-65 TaxID=3156612 RepID=UPI0032B4D351
MQVISGGAQGRGRADPEAIAHALGGCARGDAASLREIYDRLAPQMIGVALRLLRRRDLAEEVVHDAFVSIWEKASSFDPARGSAVTWVFAILRHRALNVLRAEGRTDLVDDFEPLALADDAPDAEAVVLSLSEGGALRRCLERLEPQRRAAIVLAYSRGLTHGELAGRLGIPLGTAKSWIRRSLLSLRECLA